MRQAVNRKENPDRLFFERLLWDQGINRVMGLDEVGRGCLAGPVVAAGVILKPGISHDGLRDSKKMPEHERIAMSLWIKEHAVFWYISEKSPHDIERLNILGASIQAMLECAGQKEAQPDHLLVDGNRFTACLIPYTCVVKGDDRSASIAAASILAKTHRDQLMKELHHEYPHYHWNTNVGYPTKAHFEALQRYGITKHHRRSFALRTVLEHQPA